MGLLGFPFYATRFKYLLTLVFHRLPGKFRDFIIGSVGINLSDAILGIVVSNRVRVFD